MSIENCINCRTSTSGVCLKCFNMTHNTYTTCNKRFTGKGQELNCCWCVPHSHCGFKEECKHKYGYSRDGYDICSECGAKVGGDGSALKMGESLAPKAEEWEVEFDEFADRELLKYMRETTREGKNEPILRRAIRGTCKEMFKSFIRSELKKAYEEGRKSIFDGINGAENVKRDD